MVNHSLPVTFSNTKPCMRDFHASTDIDARPARSLTELIHDELAQPLLRIATKSDEKAGELLIAGKPADKIICNCRDGIISSESLVKALTRLTCWQLSRCIPCAAA